MLVLDEPTNDLDLETLDLLQEMIADYPGTVLLVSHDRDFIDRTVSSVVAFEGAGRWLEYAGGYSDMVAQRGQGVSAKGLARAPAAAPSAAMRDTASVPPKQRSKLSFKDRHALETLPATMEKLQGEIARLQGVLADPALYARDAALFARTTEALSGASAKLAEAEEQCRADEHEPDDAVQRHHQPDEGPEGESVQHTAQRRDHDIARGAQREGDRRGQLIVREDRGHPDHARCQDQHQDDDRAADREVARTCP